MISLRKFLNLTDPEPPRAGTEDGPAGGQEMEQALRQALRLLLAAVPSPGGVPSPLPGRLDTPLEPFDVLEIAGEAVRALEQNFQVMQRRLQELPAQSTTEQSQVASTLLQAMQTLLGGLAPAAGEKDGSAKQVIADLARRLEGPLEPFDVLEIAGEALTLLEQNSMAAQEDYRQRVQQTEMANASLMALRVLLEGLPCCTGSESGQRAKRVLSGLAQRLDQPPPSAELPAIAREGLSALEQDAQVVQQRLQFLERQGEAAEKQTDLTGALLRGVRTLLGVLPQAEGEERVLSEWLRILHGPLSAPDVAGIVDQATAAAGRALDGPARKALQAESRQSESAAGQESLSRALVQALQMLIENLSTAGAAELPASRKQAIDALLHRLEQPLMPFDVFEIASDALAVLQADAAAAKESVGKECPASDRRAALAESSLQALRLLLSGLLVQDAGFNDPRPAAKPLVAELLRRLESPLAPFDVLEVANEAVALLQQDTRATVDRYRQQHEELQDMIAMLTETVAALSVQKTSSVTRLQQVERRIEQAYLLEDLRALKTNLSECLEAVREAAANQQKQAAETIQLCERHIQTAKAKLAAAPKADPVKLSPAETKKPEEIAEFVVVFMLDRENSIAARFGEEVRHNVLLFVSQHLKDSLLPADRIIRWKGAAFLGSLKRTGSIHEIRAELSAVASIQISPTVDVGERSIRLPVSLSWAVFTQSSFASLDGLFEKVDEFIAKTQGRNNTWTGAKKVQARPA
jgi:GGDEF domain-containing protein